MAHIQTNNRYPGILELLWYKPSTGQKLSALAHELLLGPSTLSSGERETIAAYTSALNDCEFCCESHNASACAHLGKDRPASVYLTPEFLAEQTPRMKALLEIAALTQKGGRNVKPENVEAARKAGASDDEIHDAVLIAAAFCMYNRYVDGLGTRPPANPADYKEMGKRLSTQGYKFPPRFLYWLVRKILTKKYP